MLLNRQANYYHWHLRSEELDSLLFEFIVFS